MHLLERALHRFFPNAGKAAVILRTLFVKRALWPGIRSGLPVDASGQPVPWITLPALDHLSQLDFSQAHVLEYGGGQSSLWWAARAKGVTTVEAEAKWAGMLREKAPANLQVIGPVEDARYAEAPFQRPQTYEVIVVDGLRRLDCAKAALPYLASHGMLLLDNSDWHSPTCGWLRSQGMMQIDFHGFGPVNSYTWCTSLFIRHQCAVPHAADARWPASVYGSLEQAAGTAGQAAAPGQQD